MSDEPRYELDDNPDDVQFPLVTNSGKVLTEADIDALVEEAERGYDVEQLRPRFKCPRCGMTSYHPKDIEQGYCGNCHDWTRGE